MKIAGSLIIYLFSAFANAGQTYLVNQTNNTINLEYLLCTYTVIYENNSMKQSAECNKDELTVSIPPHSYKLTDLQESDVNKGAPGTYISHVLSVVKVSKDNDNFKPITFISIEEWMNSCKSHCPNDMQFQIINFKLDYISVRIFSDYDIPEFLTIEGKHNPFKDWPNTF